MVIKKTRGATKKLGPISLGRRVVRFKIHGNDKRHFTVHEDLICAKSAHLKEHLQKSRKDIEGDCSICHETLDSQQSDVAFCRGSCGQNFHENCIEKWTDTQEGGPTTCPMCRKPWVKKDEGLITLNRELDADAFQLYLDWLYTGELHISEAIDRDSDEFNIHLLKAWVVSDVIDNDHEFEKLIVAQHFATIDEEDNKGFGFDAIRFAFQNQNHRYMQRFVAESVYAHAAWDVINHDMDSYPGEFVRQLCLAGMNFKQNQGTKARRELRKDWK